MNSESAPVLEYTATDVDRDIVQRVRSLCPPPEVALQVIDLARDPQVDLKQLSHLVELDPVLTAQLLRTVNSARYGLSARVNSVASAVSLIGLKSLRMLATAFGMLNPFSARLPHAMYQRYWKKSLTVGLLARELAAVTTADPSIAFTAGLVSDIGVLVLAQVDGVTYENLYQQCQPKRRVLMNAETIRFGTDHIRVGGLILREFELDPQIVQAVFSLMEPDLVVSSDTPLLARVLHMAQELSELIVQSDRDQWDRMRDQLSQDFRIDSNRLVSLMTEVATELQEWGKQFQLSVPKIDENKFREIAAAVLVDLAIDGALDISVFQSLFGSCETEVLANTL